MVSLKHNKNNKTVEILVNNQLFTTYNYSDTLYKPCFFPVYSAGGNMVCRGFPLAPKPFERIDHPHHTGMWMAFGDVNGIDFWNNSYAIPDSAKNKYGRIKTKSILTKKYSDFLSELIVENEWITHTGIVLLVEKTIFTFRCAENFRWIKCQSKLTSKTNEVIFEDSKEGLFAIRLATELETPTNELTLRLDDKKILTPLPINYQENITGQYQNSEGNVGELECWGKSAKGACVTGSIGNETITIYLIDNQNNFGTPAHFHTRGYGLFSINSLGSKHFNDTKKIQLRLSKNQSKTFEYQLIINSSQPSNIFDNFYFH